MHIPLRCNNTCIVFAPLSAPFAPNSSPLYLPLLFKVYYGFTVLPPQVCLVCLCPLIGKAIVPREKRNFNSEICNKGQGALTGKLLHSWFPFSVHRLCLGAWSVRFWSFDVISSAYKIMFVCEISNRISTGDI